MPNNGAFYIPAGDKTDETDFSVPGDQAGVTPDGSSNPVQDSYSLDNRQSMRRKHYYVHVYNGWDTTIEVYPRGTRYNDREMSKPVQEQTASTLEPGEVCVFESVTGHSHMDLRVTGLTTPPNTGTLEVTFQDRYG